MATRFPQWRRLRNYHVPSGFLFISFSMMAKKLQLRLRTLDKTEVAKTNGAALGDMLAL